MMSEEKYLELFNIAPADIFTQKQLEKMKNIKPSRFGAAYHKKKQTNTN